MAKAKSRHAVNTVATLPDLDRIAGHVHAALRGAVAVQAFTAPDATPEGAAQVPAQAVETAEQTRAALRLLADMGARPSRVPVPSNPIPLAELDTTDTRELLRLVREALPVAERIDRARGRALEPGQPFEVLGLDLAETLEHLAIRLETEVHGPADRRQEERRA